MSLPALRDKLFRILAPHAVFMVIAGATFAAVHILMGPLTLSSWLRALPMTLLEQRETLFREHLGAGFLWFLPALAAQTLLLFCYQNAVTALRWVLAGAAVLAHLCLGLGDNPALYQLPFSLSLVSYVFALGLLVNYLYRELRWNPLTSAILACAWLAASWLAIENRFFHALAGDMYQAPLSIAEPLALLCQDALILLCFFAMLRLSALLPGNLMDIVGANSLQIFLLHPFVWRLLWRLGLQDLAPASAGMEFVLTLFTFLLTVGLCLGLAQLIRRTAANVLLFPRQWAHWSTGRG
jgi:fucose 4-O-acetylase-like acetyltransferase